MTFLDVAARKLDKALPMLALAVIGVERSQRRSLEAIVTHCIPRDKCLLYVDIETYDETHLVVQLRGEQFGLSMAPAAPVLREARQGGQLASFAHVPELRVSTNAAPQKNLQHMQRGGLLVEVNGRLLMICISTLTVIERGTAETLKECQLCLSGATRASATFQQHIRLVCTDGCAGNILCKEARRGGEERRLLGRARLVRCPPHQPGARKDLHVAGR